MATMEYADAYKRDRQRHLQARCPIRRRGGEAGVAARAAAHPARRAPSAVADLPRKLDTGKLTRFIPLAG